MAASRPSSSKPASGAQRARKQPEDIHPPPKPGQMLLHESDDERSREERHHKRFSLVKRGWGQGTVTAPVFSRDMLRPYFWKDWLALGFLWCIVTLLPYPVFMFIGKWLGRLLGVFSPSRKYILKCNLKLAFPDWSEREYRSMAHRVMENFGMAIFESALAWFWSDRRLLRHAVIDDKELERARKLAATGRPILVMSCHFVTLEIMARLYALLIKPGIGVYRPSEHPVWEYAQVRGRLRSNVALVSHKDPRSMIRAILKRGYPIWYAPDQDYGRKASVFVPFFGVKEACTTIGTHNMAKLSDTAVQPSWTVREKGGRYRLHVEAELDNFPTKDVRADTIRCNQILERMILTAPAQYLWLHRRYKTMPDENQSSNTRYPRIAIV